MRPRSIQALRVGVIGAGLMGQRHALAYRSTPGVVLAGFVERNEATRDRVAEAFGVPVFADCEKMLSTGAPDAVSICLPDDAHVAASLTAFEHGVAVLLEKPIATSVADAERIAGAASGKLFLIGHLLRFDPRYQRARRMLREGRIGTPVHLTTRRNSAIGAAARYGRSTSLLFHVAIHDIDLVRWMTGREVVEVYAAGVSRRLAEYGHYDSVLAMLRLDDGTPCAMEMCWVLPEHLGSAIDSHLQIVGTAGRLEVHGFDQGLRVTDAATLQFPDTMRWTENDDGTVDGVLANEISHFVRCVRDGARPASDPAEAVAAVRIAAAMEVSLTEGRPVRLPV